MHGAAPLQKGSEHGAATPGFRAGFRPESNRENINIGTPAGLRPAGGSDFEVLPTPGFRAGLRPAGDLISVFFRKQSGQNPARMADLQPGSTIAQHPWALVQAPGVRRGSRGQTVEDIN